MMSFRRVFRLNNIYISMFAFVALGCFGASESTSPSSQCCTYQEMLENMPRSPLIDYEGTWIKTNGTVCSLKLAIIDSFWVTQNNCDSSNIVNSGVLNYVTESKDSVTITFETMNCFHINVSDSSLSRPCPQGVLPQFPVISRFVTLAYYVEPNTVLNQYVYNTDDNAEYYDNPLFNGYVYSTYTRSSSDSQSVYMKMEVSRILGEGINPADSVYYLNGKR